MNVDPADMVELKHFITLSMSPYRTLVGFAFEPLRMKQVDPVSLALHFQGLPLCQLCFL